MRRDMDIIGSLLQRISDMESIHDVPDLNIEGRTEVELDYNLALLISSGFVDGTVQGVPGSMSVTLDGLTWAGHDLLDEIRLKTSI